MQLPIVIDLSGTATLQSQVAEQIRGLIADGRLLPGAPVPTTRELALQLGLSRNTITGAYQLLCDEGYLHAERTVGTFVCDPLPEALLKPAAGPAEQHRGRPRYTLNLPLPYGGRGEPGLYRPAATGIEVDFAFGRSAARAFPEKAWRRILVECLGGAAERIGQYHDPAGLPQLRQLIASTLGPLRGMVVAAEQVVMVAGFQQGIHLAAHLFVGAGAPIVMEAPTYKGAAFLFESYGGRIVPVPVDAHGLDVSRLPPQRVKLVYVTPSHQFPTGVTMPLHRRLALLEWAAQAGAYILEVDYDADFRYAGSPLPSLQALDRNGCVIYLNSFSRSMGPGLRIGYVVLPRDLIRTGVTIKSLMDNGLPWLDQAVLAQFIRDGSFETHLKRLRHLYQPRRDALLGALRAHLPEFALSGGDAGTHLCARLPDEAPDALQLQRAAAELGVGIHPFADSPTWLFEGLPEHRQSLLLGYAHLAEEHIETGIRRIAQALHRLTSGASRPH